MTVKVVPFSDRSMENPSSFNELSVQDRLIWVALTALAVRLLGAAGGPSCVTALAATLAEHPDVLHARTR
jgi:hypothetical protein